MLSHLVPSDNRVTEMTNTDNVDHYGTSYDNFASKLYEEIRQETFGVDIGQDGWQTADEQDRFISWLNLESDSELLNVASGSGGPTLRIVQETGCSAIGIDIEQEAITEARKQVQAAGVGSKVSFEQLDGNDPLEYSDGRFDGLICVDAVNHFEHRPKIFNEWRRVLKPGGGDWSSPTRSSFLDQSATRRCVFEAPSVTIYLSRRGMTKNCLKKRGLKFRPSKTELKIWRGLRIVGGSHERPVKPIYGTSKATRRTRASKRFSG